MNPNVQALLNVAVKSILDEDEETSSTEMLLNHGYLMAATHGCYGEVLDEYYSWNVKRFV